MLTDIEIVKNSINLTGYGTSSGWLGYCERNKVFNSSLANQLIDIFLSYFFDDSISIVSSLVKINGRIIDDNLVLVSKLKKMENKLITEGYLKVVEEDQENNDDFSKFILSPSFKSFKNCNKEILKIHSFLIFIDSSLDGHCFFILKNKKIIIYPHEDTGFGFINYGNKDKINREFYDFMNEVKFMVGFNTFIKN